MKKRKTLIITLLATMFTSLLSASPTSEHYFDEDLDVAELIINVSPKIANELNPPAIGAERIVTNATVKDEGHIRTYYIEGQDVYHTGKVLSTYWIRLVKSFSIDNALDVELFINENTSTVHGHELNEETKSLIGFLLNGIYDIADMSLDHSRVLLNSVNKTGEEPLSFEIIGNNKVCEHDDLNTFKIAVTRHLERSRPLYFTDLILPYEYGEVLIPDPAIDW
jgi:hypothetical protein